MGGGSIGLYMTVKLTTWRTFLKKLWTKAVASWCQCESDRHLGIEV